MRYLLDTHTYLWSIMDDPRLSRAARDCVTDPANELHLSVGSLWESTIKIRKGSLAVPGASVAFLIERMERFSVTRLEILDSHLKSLEQLPEIHRDPFDRLLVAQAKSEGMTLLTKDEAIRRYGIPTLW